MSCRARITEVDLGGALVGGEEAFPFHDFDGPTPHDPCIAFEMWDAPPDDWAGDLEEVYGRVWSSPESWARLVTRTFGADAVYLVLKSADPLGENLPVDAVAARARRIVEAAGTPAIIVGCGHPDVDTVLMPAVANEMRGRRVVLGPAEADTYRPIAAAANDAGHAVLAYTPMDVSLAKQLNVLLTQMGIAETDLIMDPTCAALGYSFEYAYSVFERDRLAALTQNDTKMQVPILATVGKECWQTKEARARDEDLPGYGSRETRAVLWEAVSAVCLLLSGADILVMRHPAAARLVRKTVAALRGDGPGSDEPGPVAETGGRLWD